MSSSSQMVESWISSFCSLLGHEYFAEVSEDFIEDDFNLTGLSSQVPMYKEALEMILDVEPEEDEEEDEDEEDDDDDEEMGEDRPLGYRKADKRHMRVGNDLSVIENSAELLYGLIHQRYITSRQGIQQMHEKYELGHFGACPRVHCAGCKVLPVGCSDTPGQETVKLFCPGCLDIYTPPNSRFQTVDGAFFGTTFGCLFFMTFPDLKLTTSPDAATPISPVTTSDTIQTGTTASSTSTTTSSTAVPQQPTEINGVNAENFAPGLGLGSIYEPRIYGFRVSETSKTGPRMKWLRQRPTDLRTLDEVRRYHEAAAAAAAPNSDEEVEDADENEVEGDSPPPQAADRRKKAPMRRRKRPNSQESGAAPMDTTNGIDGVG